MIIHDCKQGSSKWLELRMGIPTASCFDKILTLKGKASSSQERYISDLCAELLMGRPLEGPTMPWMERGKALEAEAAAYYSLQRDCELGSIGFITTDDGRYGASPDKIVGTDGFAEIKCPKPGVHVQYLLFNGPDADYYQQVQGQLLVGEREWVDVLSYHPEMPPALVRVNRDEKYIRVLAMELEKFCERLEEAKRTLHERGYFDSAASYRKLPVGDPDAFDKFLEGRLN